MWLVGPRQPQTEGTELSPCYLFWWKYLWKWQTELLLLLSEVFVKVPCQSTTATDWRHRAISMLLILMEVLVKLAQRQSQTEGTELSPCYLSWWKYLCKWLVGPHSYSLQPQSHHHGTLFGESTCESCYLHATYSGWSIYVSGLSVHTVTDCSHRAIGKDGKQVFKLQWPYDEAIISDWNISSED